MINIDRKNIWNITALNDEILELEAEIKNMETRENFEIFKRSINIKNNEEYAQILNQLNEEWEADDNVVQNNKRNTYEKTD